MLCRSSAPAPFTLQCSKTQETLPGASNTLGPRDYHTQPPNSSHWHPAALNTEGKGEKTLQQMKYAPGLHWQERDLRKALDKAGPLCPSRGTTQQHKRNLQSLCLHTDLFIFLFPGLCTLWHGHWCGFWTSTTPHPLSLQQSLVSPQPI